MTEGIDGDLDRERFLIALLESDESQPFDPRSGFGGPVYWYVETNESQWIRHPGL
jgi:hypothetical protein